MRRSGGWLRLRVAWSSWIACAQRVAFTTESNSPNTESPAVSTTRPSNSRTRPSTRAWKARISRVVHSSSRAISRLKPETSTIKMAASFRRERGASAATRPLPLGQLGHQAEELERVGLALRAAAPLAVERVHVHRDPLRVAPGRELAERELARGVGRREPGVVRLACLGGDVDEVVAHLERALGVGERAVAGHDHGGVELGDALAGGDPVRHRPGPDDRRALDEEDVAGEEHALLGQPDQHVALGVRGPDLEEDDLLAAHAQAQLAVEGLGR